MDIEKAQEIATLLKKIQTLSTQSDQLSLTKQKISDYLSSWKQIPEEVEELHQAAVFEKIDELIFAAQQSSRELLQIYQAQLQRL